MERSAFTALCDCLRQRSLLKDTRHISIEEQLTIFLKTIGLRETNRDIADRFQHSPETISRHFSNVMKALCIFSKEVITPPDFQNVHPYIRSNEKYFPWFENCVGAIHGTHVSAWVPLDKQIPYRGRKSDTTQNVMAACDFNMCFTFILAGWEGSAHDVTIFGEAITNSSLQFPHPPEGKYYLVDSVYPNMPGFLAPYKGKRYHLNDYKGGGRQPRTAKERFNYHHSSLRMVIERTFGVLKARFPILKTMPSFPLPKQRFIVIASCAVHNFIRKFSQGDWIFRDAELGRLDNEIEETDIPSSQNIERGARARREMGIVRDEICKRVTAHYNRPI